MYSSNPDKFKGISNTQKDKEILITIDDGFESFYLEAWPFLKKNKIPFILFISTEPVGKKGYMTWRQIKKDRKICIYRSSLSYARLSY